MASVESSEHDIRTFSTRSAVHSTKAIVSCSQPLAAQCGIKVLELGGNCADAAVAVAAALNLTEPAMSGIGGDMFCLFYHAGTRTVKAINGSGRSPAGLTCDVARKSLGVPEGVNGKIPFDSPHAVTVPGTVAGWIDTLQAFGSKILSLEQILAPAIALAEQGFPISQCKESEQGLKTASPHGCDLLKRDPKAEGGYRAPKPGEYMRNSHLASTFRCIAKNGKAGFYTGHVAEEIVKALQAKGSYMTLDDLKHHIDQPSGLTEAISLRLTGQGIIKKSDAMASGIKLWEHAPNGQGLVALMTLGIIEILEKQGKIKTFTSQDHNSPEYIHAVVECLRIAFADGNWHIADPDYATPPEHLLSDTYLSQRAALFDPAKASPLPTRGSPALVSSDTTYFTVTDAQGNATSFISSLYSGFGTCIVPAKCGFALQNRGAGFVLGPSDHPNIVAPRKRQYHTIIPAMITNIADGTLNTAYGIMGGYWQPQSQVQVLFNLCVFGMNPQSAIDAPRFVVEPHDDETAPDDLTVSVEEGVGAVTVERLRKMGHIVKVVPRDLGVGQIIQPVIDPVEGTSSWTAGSDPRGDGQAVPLL